MIYSYKTTGVCSRKIDVELENGVIKAVKFEGGCNGNLQGISKLVEGRKAEDVIEICKGICCGTKKTSCPDQLTLALKQAMENEKNAPSL